MSAVLLGWPAGAEPPDVEAAAALALGEWAGPDDTLNPADQRRAVVLWAMWETAAAAWGVNPHPNPALPRHLACWAVALLDAGYSPASVRTMLAGVDWWCRTQFSVGGVPVRLPGMTRHAVLVVQAWAAEFGVTPGRGESPVPRAWLVEMAEAMIADGSPLALRDLVALTWGYSGALRAGELGVIAAGDLDIHSDHIEWEFAASKGNQDGSRSDDTAAVWRTGDALDPLDALDRLRAAGWNPTLPTAPIIPAFREGGGGRLPDPADQTVEGISVVSVRFRVRGWAEAAGLPHPELVSPHALRHSRATHLVLDGASEAQVQRVLRHREWATTLRYISKLEPWVEPAVAREVMLGPTGDGYADLDVPRKNPRRQRGAPVDWGGLEERLAVTDELARLGPYAPGTRRLIDAELGRWDRWQTEMGLAGTDPSAVQLLAWTAWRIDLATTIPNSRKAAGVPPKARTMRATLSYLEAGLASRGTAAGTVTGPAHDVLAGYARRADVKARAAQKSAPVFSLDDLERLAFVAGCPPETDARRWATGLAALALHSLDPGAGAKFPAVPPSAVQVLDPDTRLVAVDGSDPIIVGRGPKPPLDPVTALDWLAANTLDDAATILDPAALTRAKTSFKNEGSQSVSGLVALGSAVVERACWRLAAPLVRAVRAQATVAAMTSGALRYDDLAGVRLENVHDVPGGGLGCPILDKGGPVIEGGDVWFEPDPLRPALDFSVQFGRLVEWLPWGARGPLAARCEAQWLVAVGPPAASITASPLIVYWLAPVAVRAGVCPGLQLHSFRRSAATWLWWRLRDEGVPDTEAVERVRRKLRHKDAAVTVGTYICRIDPSWSAAADLPAYEPEELRDARTPIHATGPHRAA